MSSENFLPVHPLSGKTCGFDWSKRLSAGVTISGTPTVTASNGAVSSVTKLNDDTYVAFRYTPNGIADGEYKITCIVPLSDGDTDVDTAKIRVDSNV